MKGAKNVRDVRNMDKHSTPRANTNNIQDTHYSTGKCFCFYCDNERLKEENERLKVLADNLVEIIKVKQRKEQDRE